MSQARFRNYEMRVVMTLRTKHAVPTPDIEEDLQDFAEMNGYELVRSDAQVEELEKE